MEGLDSVHSFFSKLATRPHIAENIVRRLIFEDIESCLKASDEFKPLIAAALNWNQDDFEDAEARSALTSRTLEAKQFGPLKRGSWKDKGERFCFGLDGTLWMCKTKSTKRQDPDWFPPDDDASDEENQREDGYSHTLTVYSLKSGKEISTLRLTCEDPRPRVRILPCKKVLVQDKHKLTVFSNGDNGKTVDILEEHRLEPCVLGLVPQPFYGEDCIFKLIRTEDEEEDDVDSEFSEYKICFCRADGHLMTDSPIKLYIHPEHFILQKGQYVMTLNTEDDPGGFMMCDIAHNKFIWKEEEGCSYEADILLTTTFCGFLDAEIQEERSEEEWNVDDEYFASSEKQYMGGFRLSLFDNENGENIYNQMCTSFARNSEDELPPMKPRIVASGNYLLACSTQGGSPDDARDERVEIREYIENHQWLISNQGMDNRLLCIKVDPESKKCMERETNTGYEMVLLARALLEEKSLLNGTETERPRVPNVDIQEIHFLGYAFESVVVCQVDFDFIGFYKMFNGCQTILTIDLEKIFEYEEPASVFSAVHFPLGHSVLENSGDFPKTGNKVEYYPYYESSALQDGSGRVKLAGIVVVSSEKSTPMMPKIYSFRKGA